MKKSICLIAAFLFMAAGQGFGTDFKDGGTHNINYTIMTTEVRVDYQAPGMQTTVNLLNGGYISGELETYQDSRTNITGGSVGGQLQAFDSSRVNISGGVVSGRWDVFGSSQVTISGGLLGYMYTNDNSRITMSDGSVDTFLMTYGGSQLTMSGGMIGRNIQLESESILTIDGSGFAIDGKPFGYGEIASISGGDYSNEPYRTLTGTLANGDIINNDFRIGDSCLIILTPEPATLLLLGLGGLALRRKK